MANIFNLLLGYGFEVRDDHMFWGMGSISNGTAVKVAREGNMVVITTDRFFCNGEIEADSHTVVRCHLSRIWENLPASALR